MNIPKLFRMSSGIAQEFWMFCVVKLNAVTQTTQICELQSTVRSPTLYVNSSGSMPAIPTHWRAFEPSVWFQEIWQRCWRLKYSNIWTNADNRIEERSTVVLPHWKAGYSVSPQLSATPGQPAGPAAYAAFRSRASTQGRSNRALARRLKLLDQRESWGYYGWENIGFD